MAIQKTLRRGDTLRLKYGFEGIDLSDAVAKIQIRRDSKAGVTLDSSSAGTITNTYSNNETIIEWVVPYQLTETMGGDYVFDLQTTLEGERTTWVTGILTVQTDITR